MLYAGTSCAKRLQNNGRAKETFAPLWRPRSETCNALVNAITLEALASYYCCGASEPEASERSSSLIGVVCSQKVNFLRRFGFWSCAFRMRSCAMAYNFITQLAQLYVIVCSINPSIQRRANLLHTF